MYGDFYGYDLSNADVIFVFLNRKVFRKMKEKINKELKEGLKIIVSNWPIENINPLESSIISKETKYYLYNKKVNGLTRIYRMIK